MDSEWHHGEGGLDGNESICAKLSMHSSNPQVKHKGCAHSALLEKLKFWFAIEKGRRRRLGSVPLLSFSIKVFSASLKPLFCWPWAWAVLLAQFSFLVQICLFPSISTDSFAWVSPTDPGKHSSDWFQSSNLLACIILGSHWAILFYLKHSYLIFSPHSRWQTMQHQAAWTEALTVQWRKCS